MFETWPPDIGVEPYYSDKWQALFPGDCLNILPELPDDSVDLLVTDPPYGISFMGKDWDRALPDKRIWVECLRVLKPGAFAFVMSIPRSDCQARMVIALQDAGFRMDFTPIYWVYATGFPKAQNMGKAVDKRLGVEPLGKVEASGVGFMTKAEGHGGRAYMRTDGGQNETKVRIMMPEPTTPQAKALDGSYGGFQPKPAVEVIIVAMKPLSEKTFVDQALKNQKGITWLDDCKVPYESDGDKESARFGTQMDIRNNNYKTPQGVYSKNVLSSQSGRFPANLLVSDDALNDGQMRVSKRIEKPCDTLGLKTEWGGTIQTKRGARGYTDSGSFSRYFDLDKFFEGLLDKLKSKAYNNEKNIGDTQWEISQVEERSGLKNKLILASGAEDNSLIMPVTESVNTTSAQQDVMPYSDFQDLSQGVKSAEERPDYTETGTALSLAQIKQDTETLLQTILKDNETLVGQKQHSLLSQNVANYVVSKLQDLSDITQTIINQPRLFGSVLPAIIRQMQQDLSQDQLWQNFWQERVKLLSESQRQTFPFAVVGKASKSEKNKGVPRTESEMGHNRFDKCSECGGYLLQNPDRPSACHCKVPQRENNRVLGNNHPTVKPIKLVSYLITLGSREGDIVLDPFLGSGTTALASQLLNRKCIGIELNEEYCEIAANRCAAETVARIRKGEY